MEDRLKNPNFQNWVKGVLFLDAAASQFRDFVEPIIKQWHQTTTQAHPLPTNHAICTFQNAAKCPIGTCDKFKQVVETAHRCGKPTFSNTELHKCWTNPWELSKCYMPYGYRDVHTSLETDFAGVVTVILNHLEFQQHVTHILSAPNNTFYQAKDVRNSIMHNSSFEITSQTLQYNRTVICQTLYALKCPSVFSTLKSIDEIEKDTLPLHKASSAFTLAVESFKQLQKELAITIPEIEELAEKLKIETREESEQQKQELITQTSKGKYELEQTTMKGINTLEDKTVSGTKIIESQATKASKKVYAKQQEGVSVLDDKIVEHENILNEKRKEHEHGIASAGRRVGDAETDKIRKEAEETLKRNKQIIDKIVKSKLKKLQEDDSLNKIIDNELHKQADILDKQTKNGLKQLQTALHTYMEWFSNESTKHQNTFGNMQRYIEQADRKIAENIETIQEKEKDLTEHADGKIAEYIEITQKTGTEFTEEADRKIAEYIETIQEKEKDFTERADRKIAEYIKITREKETEFTEIMRHFPFYKGKRTFQKRIGQSTVDEVERKYQVLIPDFVSTEKQRRKSLPILTGRRLEKQRRNSLPILKEGRLEGIKQMNLDAEERKKQEKQRREGMIISEEVGVEELIDMFSGPERQPSK